MTTLKKLLLTLTLALGLASGIDAATYYAANCATGCLAHVDITNAACDTAGSKANPVCLDVNGDGLNESIGMFFDTFSTADNLELLAGDKLKLCATDCDGADTAIFPVRGINEGAPSGNCGGEAIIVPRVNDFVVSSYGQCSITTSTECDFTSDCPGGETCNRETVTINGDVDDDDAVDAGDVQSWITNPFGKSGWAIRNLTFLKSADWGVCAQSGGLPGVTMDGVALAECSSEVWGNTTGLYNAGDCGITSSGNVGCMLLQVHNTTSPFVFKNGSMHTACYDAVRATSNPGSENAANPEVYTFTFDNNTFTNVVALEFWDTHNIKISNNTFVDTTNGASAEDRVSYALIEGNTIECRGTYKVYDQGGLTTCNSFIRSDQGDNGSAQAGKSHHITIRNNKGFGRSGVRVNAGINFDNTYCDAAKGCPFSADPSYLIENNLIYGLEPGFSGIHISRAGIGVRTSNTITVQNNTIRDVRYGIVMQANGIAPEVRNNIITNIRSGGIALVPSGPSLGHASSFTYNNIFDDAGGQTLIRGCNSTDGSGNCNGGQTSWFCTDIDSCPNFPIPANNVSAASVFVAVAGGTETWNLHLGPTDVANLNVAPTGAQQDFDNTNRPQGGAWEIGADEIPSGFPCGSFEGDCESLFDADIEGCAVMGAIESFSPVQGRCSNALTTVCTNGSECSGGGTCTILQAGRCSTTQTTTCVINGDCPVGACSVSAVACHTDAECGLGQTCVAGESCVTTGNGSLVHGGSNTALLEGSSIGPQCGSVIVPLAGLSAGVTYRIACFYQALGAAAGDKKLSVTVDGVEKCSITTNASSWTAFPTCDFVAAGATAELKFLKAQQAAGFTSYRIDDCTLVPQP